MPLRLRAQKNIKRFNMPVSYKADAQDRMLDAKNVYSNGDILETRPGLVRFNATAFSEAPNSISYFRDNSSNSYLLAKDQTVLYKANATGAHTSLKTGLTAANKHRGVAFGNANNIRHIIAIGSDGLFQYNGSTFTQLGEDAPGGVTVGVSGSGNTLSASTYQVAITFYDSTNGFETNIGTTSSTVTITGTGEQIDVSAIPTSASNSNIDKKRIYLKDVGSGGDWVFWAEIALATTTDTIDDDPSSTLAPPTKNAKHIAGGAKYLAVYGNKLATAGNTASASEIFLSEEYIPDAFDGTLTRTVVVIGGEGPITGIAVGFFNDSNLDPYLVGFKRNRIELYSEVGGVASKSIISADVGCVSHDSIQVVNGNIYFLSSKGWRVIVNGRLVEKGNKPITLAMGDIDDIFTRNGYVYELNKSNYDNFFSVYYPTLDHYMTFISEGSNTSISKAYNYEFEIGGFRPYQFSLSFTDGALGLDTDGEEVVYLAGQGGYIYEYSIKNDLTDIDIDNANENIDAFCLLWWTNGNDLDASYNFGPLIIRALSSQTEITVKTFLDYDLQTVYENDFEFSNPTTGFILDVSKLDENILSDGRTIVRYIGEIFKSGQSLLLGFYKNAENESISLIEGQIDVQKNGNPN